MKTHVDGIRKDFRKSMADANSQQELDEVYRVFLARKGKIASLYSLMGGLATEERPEAGKLLNQLKKELEQQFNDRRKASTQKVSLLDTTIPGRTLHLGREHPLTQTESRIVEIFTRMGFTVAEGPEVESEYYDFDALNTPFWHPARDKSDTLYLDNGHLLRTETSPVQIHVMEKRKPPIRIIAPGRVYRNDKPDASHSPMFMQVEGLYIDKKVTFAELKGTLLEFYRQLFGEDTSIRFRPHYFPFTEPSAEVDVTCFLCSGQGCRVCKQTGWLEMGGSGMVDPVVLEGVGIDPEEYTGFAFGLGLERIAMLQFGITDIRVLYENNLRFLNQF
jgi:phenylalanyl-tRNA synthetase alpha chain